MIKKNKGFTFVEVMVVMGIFGLITAAIYGALATANRSWLIGEGLINAQQSPRFALENMLREMRLASSANVVDNRTVRFSIPFDADGDGFLDVITGTTSLIYGAEDPQDYDSDGVYWEEGWQIEYQIDALNHQIIRQVLDDTGNVRTQRILVRDINPLDADGDGFPDTSFQAILLDPQGVEYMDVGRITDRAVVIRITTQVNTVQGRQINPPLQTTLTTRVNLRN